jgi:hypothetical protein
MPDFKTIDVAQWWAYWRQLPRTGLLPDRVALNPGEIRHLLPNMMVFDMADPAAVRFRLAGTEIATRYGFDPTGTDFLDLLDPATRKQSRQLLHAAVRYPFAILSALRSRYGSGLTAEIEALAIPFANGEGAVPQLVTVSLRVADTSRLADDPDSLNRVEATGFTFIDLGAGLPDGLDGPTTSS